MSKENMDEKFSIVIDINENYESYREHAKSNKDEFKNKFVLLYTTWNDYGFYTKLVVRNFYEDPNGKIIGTIRICHDDLKIDNYDKEAREIRHFLEKDYNSKEKFNETHKLGNEYISILVVRNFNENSDGKIIGTIRICHDDLKIDNYDKEAREIRHFLEKDYKQEVKIDKENKLSDKYISIADSVLYDNLKKELGKDESVIEFLSRLNEISTITENKKIKRVENKDWYKDSFIREVENRKIVDFTKYKNDIDIKENSYYVLKKLPEYFDNIKKNIAGLYKWALNYDLSIEEARQVSYTIKKRKEKVTKNIACEDDVINKFKNRFAGHTEFIEEIDEIFGINEDFYKAIGNIKDILRVEEGDLEKLAIGHYTSLETIKILIKKRSNKGEGPYLRLTNGRQMNDPLEGKVLLDYILNRNKNLDENTNSKDWEPTFWYLSSATTELDSLPMWKQYGDNAKGGMLIYDCNYLKDIMKQGVEIYKVAYIKNNKDDIEVLSDNNIDSTGLKAALEALRGETKKMGKDKNEKYYMSLLSNIGFLFKKSDYAYENEYRIVVNREKNEDKIEEQANHNYNFPFLYTYLRDIELKYSKVILGPKAVDIDYIAPYISYCDKDIKIERSSISYR